MSRPLSSLPATKGVALSPNNAASFPATRGVYVGVAGNLRVVFRDDAGTVTNLANVPVGVWPFSIVELHATGTSATNIVGLY